MDSAERAYAREVGRRLRLVRKQQRYSLQAVEALSAKEFKASVLGAYERGERSISVPRLRRLAAFYRVDVEQLLPRPTSELTPAVSTTERAARILDDDRVTIDLAEMERAASVAAPTTEKCTIDLQRLRSLEGPERELLERYLGMIQVQRQDFNGRVMTVRREDLRIIGALLGLSLEGMIEHIDRLGLRALPEPR
ncbi:helix-turn-helix domain protein [Acidimicrobium ferrooxidans DSM 10331]|uniref:Helix-turn-helix domain protein n=1 Tax=Acidimicrobium ferrooxidans (strain DSM 10331 / JCM 15462 / NBRC 103882 / ICP) TaxID=525909 RepID=C7LZR3_ACIFD|nr:transcriptional regulator [Acidimicrobium ferrooxidans]ACU54221.1 helix-turn-helix domain protein [Acidimicrobium ferrooxidans DSM 10331]